MTKSLNDDPQLQDRFGINLTFPDAYSTVKDTANFVWIEKEVAKGHLNIITYTLPINIDLQKIEERIPAARDQLKNICTWKSSRFIYDYRESIFSYYYKTKVNNLDAILTKGTWEVQNDFMAGPYVNYILLKTQ